MEKPLFPRSRSRRVFIRSVLGVIGAASAESLLGRARTATAAETPPPVSTSAEYKTTEIHGPEKARRVAELNVLLGDFLSTEGVKTIKAKGFYSEQDILVAEIEDKDGKSVLFQRHENGKNLSIGTFRYIEGVTYKEFDVYTDKKGEDRLDELTQATGALMRVPVSFEQGGFIDQRDLENFPVDREIEVPQTTIYSASVPSKAGVLKHPDLPEYMIQSNTVMVHPAGFFRLMQKEEKVFDSLENKLV